jgi:hypothetical protein
MPSRAADGLEVFAWLGRRDGPVADPRPCRVAADGPQVIPYAGGQIDVNMGYTY